MEFFKRSLFVGLSVLCLTFCVSNHQRQMDFTQEMIQVYYETVVESNQMEAVKFNFYIEFEERLSEEICLQKVYFRNHQALIEKVSDTKYVAHFPQTAVLQDFILDNDSRREYGNKAPIIVKPKFELSEDEAVLEYRKNNETNFFKLIGINEK